MTRAAFYVQKMVHYDAKQKATFKAAVEELVAEGLVEKHDDTVILTAKGKEAIS
jgi:Mn-dependent DtxR family transcriptional regulator